MKNIITIILLIIFNLYLLIILYFGINCIILKSKKIKTEVENKRQGEENVIDSNDYRCNFNFNENYKKG